VIRSRIGLTECKQLIHACDQAADLLAAIPAAAHLRDADPAVHGGLYDQALAVFNRLLTPGIRFAKLSKILHLKRPRLFPILDSRVLRAYRRTAAETAIRYRTERPGFQLLYWAAVRDDVIASGNIAALAALRELLHQDADSRVQRAAMLTDVRLLDILTWHSAV
jgi:hypothetical protein